jgi:hypothetical protein
MRSSSRIVGAVTLMAGAVTLVVGCGSTEPPPASAISGLHFTTATMLPSNPPPSVDITLTAPTPARAVYVATLALPDFPSGTFSCPFDSGIRYTLTFRTDAGATTSAVLNPGGCGDVEISGSSERRVIDPAYWAVLAQNLSIPQATIYPR